MQRKEFSNSFVVFMRRWARYQVTFEEARDAIRQLSCDGTERFDDDRIGIG